MKSILFYVVVKHLCVYKLIKNIKRKPTRTVSVLLSLTFITDSRVDADGKIKYLPYYRILRARIFIYFVSRRVKIAFRIATIIALTARLDYIVCVIIYGNKNNKIDINNRNNK